MQVKILNTRHYLGVGLLRTGEIVDLNDALAEQLKEQGFAAAVEPARKKPEPQPKEDDE